MNNSPEVIKLMSTKSTKFMKFGVLFVVLLLIVILYVLFSIEYNKDIYYKVNQNKEKSDNFFIYVDKADINIIINTLHPTIIDNNNRYKADVVEYKMDSTKSKYIVIIKTKIKLKIDNDVYVKFVKKNENVINLITNKYEK